MKRTITLSKATIYLIVLAVVAIVYLFAFFTPAQADLGVLKSELALFNAQNATYREYLTDSSPLEADIAAIQEQIDELNANGYTNGSTVNFTISDAIQRYQVSLTAVSLDSVTTFENYRVLPINLSMSGSLENILAFIEHFEQDEEGSYMVRGSSIELAGQTANAAVVIYLCTPNL